MIPWTTCCCEDDPFFFFVPCPGTDSCAEGFFALKSQWTVILGEVPVVDDVWKYNDPDREEPCDFCGKFQTDSPEPLGSFAPSSGFEKQDDCNDPDCPLPLLFFVPCDDELCGAYTMAALVSEWETFLGLTPGTIDLADPTTYAGTWLFERTDGTECCEDPAEEPCFKFCGNLSLAGSTDLCFDDATKPLTEQCLKCDVPDGKVQRLNASSAVSFTLQDNCEDSDCPVVCRTQGCQGDYLKVSGTKVFLFESLIEASEFDDDFQSGSFDGRIEGEGKNEIRFGVVLQYETYLEANATTWDGVSSVNAWDQIYSNHCKPDPGCTVVSNIQVFNLVDGGFAHKSTISHVADNDDNNPQDVSTEFTSTTTFSIPDQEDTMGGSKLQKRKDIYEDAITKGCNLSNSPGGWLEICEAGTTNDDCVMVWSNNLTTTSTNPLLIETSTDYVETGSFPGTLTDTANFNLKMATSMVDFNAKDDCCCTDIPEFEGMFWTDANSFIQFSSLFLQMHDQGIASGILPRFKLGNVFSQWRNGEFKPLFDGPGTNNWDLGKFGNPYVDADEKEDYICGSLGLSWSFSFDHTATQDDMVINPLDAVQQASRRLMIEASISDTITSIECVDAPPEGCEDGTIDIP